MAIIPSFGLGSFFQIAVLLVNAIAILSEDRFLARIGLSSATHDPAFGAGPGGDQSFQYKLMNMIASVRMVTRSTYSDVSLCSGEKRRKLTCCLSSSSSGSGEYPDNTVRARAGLSVDQRKQVEN